MYDSTNTDTVRCTSAEGSGMLPYIRVILLLLQLNKKLRPGYFVFID